MSKAQSNSTPANIAARDFKDAGTGKSFVAGQPVDASEGELANYRAAGLLQDDAPASADKPAA